MSHSASSSHAADADRRAGARRAKIATVLLVSLIGVPTVFLLLIGAPAALPFDIEALARAHPPFEDRSRRVPSRACGLAQIRDGDACVAPEVTGVTHHEVTFASRLKGKGRPVLRGTLSVPTVAQSGPRPGVVLVHGSGPNSRDQPSPGDLIHRFDDPFPVFAHLADHLTARGFIVLRYDKRSCSACYDGKHTDFARFRFTDFVADAQDAVAFLAQRPGVAPGSIVVVGHSQGGQLAPFIARGSSHVAAVVMLAGPLDNFRDGALGQLERVAQIREEQYDYLGAWSVRQLNLTPLQTCFEKLETNYDPDEFCIGGGVTQAALREYIALGDQTLEVLQGLGLPIFAAQGTLDRNIDPGDIRDLRDQLEGDAEFHYILGMNHALTNSLEPSSPPALDPALLSRLDRFLDSVPHR